MLRLNLGRIYTGRINWKKKTGLQRASDRPKLSKMERYWAAPLNPSVPYCSGYVRWASGRILIRPLWCREAQAPRAVVRLILTYKFHTGWAICCIWRFHLDDSVYIYSMHIYMHIYSMHICVYIYIYLRAAIEARELFFRCIWQRFLAIRPGPTARFLGTLYFGSQRESYSWNHNQKMRTFLNYDLSNFQSDWPSLASIKSIQTGKFPNNFSIIWLLWALYLRNYHN